MEEVEVVRTNPVLSKHENTKTNVNMNNNCNLKSNHNPHVRKVKTIQGKEVVIMSINIRGWQSKAESLSNIARDQKVDIFAIQETHCYGNKAPKIKGYVSYFRNRQGKSKGGIAFLIFEKLAKFVTKLETGEESEHFSIQLNCFAPSLVLMNYYGPIEGQLTKPEVLKIQSNVFNQYEFHKESGSRVILLGDMNNHIGKKLGMIHNTNDKESNGGKNLINWVEQQGLKLVNVLDQSHTHYDVSSKKNESNVIDYIIIDDMSIVKDFKVDSEKLFTPYRTKCVKGKREPVHTDHRSLRLTLTPVWSKKPTTNKITGWNYSKEGGDERYKDLTDEMSFEFAQKIETEPDINKLYNWYLEKLDEIKMLAYGKTSSTITKAKKVADDMIWHNRLNEVSKSINSLTKRKINDKVWELRSKTSLKYADQQFVSVKDPETGLLTRNREETYECMLNYNYGLLRKDKVINDEEMDESDAFKDILIESGMKAKELEKDAELTWEEFQEVLTKVKLTNKSVYRDLTKAGPMFLRVYFDFLNRMYVTEDTPDDFNSTTLMKLFKNKGNRNELKYNRFIHLKPHTPKVFERMVMLKIEKRLAHSTPEFQIGGQKLCSTTEHLLTLMTYMRKLENTQGGGICQFIDIKSCFDVIELRSILSETVKSGVVGKPLRNIKNFSEVIKITIQGDESGKSKTVTNSAGQGSGYAPVGTSLAMASVIDDKIQREIEQQNNTFISSLGLIKLSPMMFVDDFSKCNATPQESRTMGKVLTHALKDLKMEAHPEKSCLLVFGRNRDKLKEELKVQPTILQGFEMQSKPMETYLGMQFSENGTADTITKTLLARRVKCLVKCADLKQKLQDPRVQALGWLVTAVTVFKATIVPTLLYGCGAWVGLNKGHKELIESIQRQCLINILEISNKCSYQTLLHVTQIEPALEIVKKTKVTFINDLFHIRGKGICKDTLEAEYKMTPDKGLIAEVKEICKEWKIPDVSESYVSQKVLKRLIGDNIKRKVLLETLSCRAAPYTTLRVQKGYREYFQYPKERALLGLAYDVGCLNLRAHRKSESLKKWGTFKCHVPACTGDDNLQHVIYECQGYNLKMKDNGIMSEYIDFLYELNKERKSRFMTSMINWKS